jgi:hypothetical protein
MQDSGDSPAWHVSETDVVPGDPVPAEDEMSPATDWPVTHLGGSPSSQQPTPAHRLIEDRSDV